MTLVFREIVVCIGIKVSVRPERVGRVCGRVVLRSRQRRPYVQTVIIAASDENVVSRHIETMNWTSSKKHFVFI